MMMLRRSLLKMLFTIPLFAGKNISTKESTELNIGDKVKAVVYEWKRTPLNNGRGVEYQQIPRITQIGTIKRKITKIEEFPKYQPIITRSYYIHPSKTTLNIKGDKRSYKHDILYEEKHITKIT